MEKKIIITFLILCNLFSIFAQEFTIAVIPDTQSYVDINTNHDTDSKYLFNHDKLFFNQMEFISKNSISNGGNIAFAIHVGDLVNHQGDYLIEWEKAYKGISIFFCIALFICIQRGKNTQNSCSVRLNEV